MPYPRAEAIWGGSSFISNREFRQFLNIARRSTFETANMVILLERRSLIAPEHGDRTLELLDRLARKITAFQRTLT